MINNHSIQYSIQKQDKIIHSQNLFIQIGKSYSIIEVKYAKVNKKNCPDFVKKS